MPTAGHRVSTAGQIVSPCTQSVGAGGHLVCTTGHWVSVGMSTHRVRIGGQCVSTGGHRVAAREVPHRVT